MPTRKGTSVMADQKFTPGPWTEDFSAALGAGRWVIEAQGMSVDIAVVQPQTNAEANARLIAKAPEMYGALKGIRAVPVGGPLMDVEMWKIQDLLRDIEGETG